MEKQKKVILNNCFMLFVLFFIIALLFPYSGDDWTWGSSAGLEYLRNFFDNYNGRYFGNLLVIALTRSKLLDAAVMAVSYVLVCFFCYSYSQEKAKLLIWSAALLFFIMPTEIWAQTIVWTSGYSNYVPSALISAAFLLVARNALDPLVPKSEKLTRKSLTMFALGFSGALFVENVTVFNILFAAAMILYFFLRFRIYHPDHLGFLFGAILGACVMFSNSAYHTILQGDDYYRYTPKSIAEIVEMVLQHAGDILNYIIYDNLLFCGIVTVLLVVLRESWRLSEGRKEKLGWGLLIFHVGSFGLICCKDSLLCFLGQLTVLSRRMELLVGILVALLYVLSLLMMVLCYVEKGRRLGMLLPIYCVAGSLMPLLVVNPIGPRCVFIGYFFMMVFAVDLLGYLRARLMPEEKYLGKLIRLIVLMQALVFVNIFYPVCYYETLRSDFLEKQAREGCSSILICDLPNMEYLWNSSPKGTSLLKRYQVFHGLDEHVTIEIIPREDLKTLAEAYK